MLDARDVASRAELGAIDLAVARIDAGAYRLMETGGRILHHLQRFLPEKKNTVLFVGFQAAGTGGRSIVDDADEVKLLTRFGGDCMIIWDGTVLFRRTAPDGRCRDEGESNHRLSDVDKRNAPSMRRSGISQITATVTYNKQANHDAANESGIAAA